jgi:hypothetical protein
MHHNQTGLFPLAPKVRQLPEIRPALAPNHTPEVRNYPIDHWGVFENKLQPIDLT